MFSLTVTNVWAYGQYSSAENACDGLIKTGGTEHLDNLLAHPVASGTYNLQYDFKNQALQINHTSRFGLLRITQIGLINALAHSKFLVVVMLALGQVWARIRFHQVITRLLAHNSTLLTIVTGPLLTHLTTLPHTGTTRSECQQVLML